MKKRATTAARTKHTDAKSVGPGRPRLYEKRVNIGLSARVLAALELLAEEERRPVASATAILLEEALRARGRLK